MARDTIDASSGAGGFRTTRRVFLTGLLASAAAGCASAPQTSVQWIDPDTLRARRLIRAAEAQVGVTTSYDGSYKKIGYPDGDVPMSTGVCTDVVIRAYRTAFGLDLQRLIHEDMEAHFDDYPNLPKWGLAAPDPNIDHRRVLNMRRFFQRYAEQLPVSSNPADYRPGDIITQSDGQSFNHVAIVTDKLCWSGKRYELVHNISRGTQVNDMLFAYPINGHFRFLPPREAAHLPVAALKSYMDRSRA